MTGEVRTPCRRKAGVVEEAIHSQTFLAASVVLAVSGSMTAKERGRRLEGLTLS